MGWLGRVLPRCCVNTRDRFVSEQWASAQGCSARIGKAKSAIRAPRCTAAGGLLQRAGAVVTRVLCGTSSGCLCFTSFGWLFYGVRGHEMEQGPHSTSQRRGSDRGVCPGGHQHGKGSGTCSAQIEKMSPRQRWYPLPTLPLHMKQVLIYSFHADRCLQFGVGNVPLSPTQGRFAQQV